MNNFSVASVFSDYCVLQRNKPINIFGTVDSPCTITVTLTTKRSEVLSTNTLSFNTKSESPWNIQLAPQKKRKNCYLNIHCEFSKMQTEEDITFHSVAIGEVWICAGQSNMEFELQACTEAPTELENSFIKRNLRYYYTNKLSYIDEDFYKTEKQSSWQTWKNGNPNTWSALGYFFAKQLAINLNCTIGLIGCNWGGTSASSWVDEQYLEQDKDLKTYLTDYKALTKGKSVEQQIKEYDNYLVKQIKWDQKFKQMGDEDATVSWDIAEKKLGKNPWPGPASVKSPLRPCGLYQTMFKRISSYTTKGILWYQGESDDQKPTMYAKLFSSLIQNWRNEQNDQNLPFIFVQLANHRYMNDKDFKNWPIIRDQQLKVFNTVKNTWMCVGMDKGEFNDIHPKSKKDIAQRMCNIALNKIYHHPTYKQVISPTLKNALFINNKVVLTFKNALFGLKVVEQEELLNEYKQLERIQKAEVPHDFTGFEIAASDKVYYPAHYTFNKIQNKMTLTNPNVLEPQYVRYAWYNYGPTPIYSREGLPLSPFTTEEY